MSFKILEPQGEMNKVYFVLGQNKLTVCWLVWERKKLKARKPVHVLLH